MVALTHLVVLDFEATCDDEDPPTPQEVIEFPSVLLSTEDFAVVDELESFVRPVHHPVLRTFCKDLTGIEQSDVDRAPVFSDVLEAHLGWLRSHGLPVEGELPFAVVTCGDWDLQTMLPVQMSASAPPLDWVPPPYRRWINVKVPFKQWIGREARAGMAGMLAALGLELEGRHHRGIDDCRNIARIVRALVERGQTMELTSALPPSRYPPIPLTLEWEAEQREVVLAKRKLTSLLGLASGAFRRQAKAAYVGPRQLDEDADLFDLRRGAVLRVG